MQDYARVQRRDHAKFAQKSGEHLTKLLEIRHAPRTKNIFFEKWHALSQRALHTLQNVAES